MRWIGTNGKLDMHEREGGRAVASFIRSKAANITAKISVVDDRPVHHLQHEPMMEAEFNHLNRATWECNHVVFTPKYRKKLLFGKTKRHLGQVFHDLARRKECRIEEGHLMPDHVHMLVSIPPEYSVAQIIGYTGLQLVPRQDCPLLSKLAFTEHTSMTIQQ